MPVKFYYFSKKLSKTDGLAAPRDLHPSHSYEQPCHTGVLLCQCAGHGGGSFHFAACGSLIVSLAPCRGSWRISPQARRTLNVSVCPMLRRALFLSKFRGLSARKGTPCNFLTEHDISEYEQLQAAKKKFLSLHFKPPFATFRKKVQNFCR